MKYLTDEQAKAEIIQAGKTLYLKNMVSANDGNISVKVGCDSIWITTSGVSKGFLKEENLVKTDLDGNVLEGCGKISSESRMHLLGYRQNDEIMAICHAHPPKATAFAVAGQAMDLAILPEIVVNVGVVPLVPYSCPGSDAVGDRILPYYKTHNGVLLENHGVTTWGSSIKEAIYRMEAIEHCASQIQYALGTFGSVNVFNSQEVDELLQLRKKMGITRGCRPKSRSELNESEKRLYLGNSTYR